MRRQLERLGLATRAVAVIAAVLAGPAVAVASASAAAQPVLVTGQNNYAGSVHPAEFDFGAGVPYIAPLHWVASPAGTAEAHGILHFIPASCTAPHYECKIYDRDVVLKFAHPVASHGKLYWSRLEIDGNIAGAGVEKHLSLGPGRLWG